jgi:hypothetical protein
MRKLSPYQNKRALRILAQYLGALESQCKETCMLNKKHCPGCDLDLDIDLFSWKNVAKGIRQTWCKRCLKSANRSHYLNTTQIYKNRAIERNKKLREKGQRKLFEYLSTHPCVDCGNTDIRCLEFDHVRGTKLESIAELLSRATSWTKIEAELAKCEVRCANCHRLKTNERGGYWKHLQIEQAEDN